jgi:hypothetical protein
MSKETKKYRLLKDLPDGAIKGDVYITNGYGKYTNERMDAFKSPVIEHNAYYSWQVEDNKDWFEEVLPEQSKLQDKGSGKEKETVSSFDFNNGVKVGIDKVNKWHYQAVSNIRNGDKSFIISSGNSMVIARLVNYKHESNASIEVIEVTNGYKKITYHNAVLEKALNEDTVVDSNAYQCYLRDCDCSSAGIILHNGKPVCRWCRKSYGKGGMINYLPEHFQSEKSDTVVEDKVVPETKTMGSLSTYTEGFQAGIYWNQKYGNEPIPKDFMEVVQKLNLHQPIPEKLTPTDNTQTVTDNSDVACLSLNDLHEVWATDELNKGGYFRDSPLYKNFEQKVKEKLKKSIHLPN